jgi:hypothetical protein
MWGAEAVADALLEAYADAPGGWRLVQYFDKSRMEITDPRADPGSLWYVTNGLLAKELVTGQMQVGNGITRQYEPAMVQVAGDPGPDAPTYAIFNKLMGSPALPVGSTIIQTLDNEGKVGTYRLMSEYGVVAAVYVGATKHSVASVFWEFMNSSGLVLDGDRYAQGKLFQDPFYASGYPLTEAYWMTVRVGGAPKRVLVQVFERRVLTYTPDNPDGWKVEAGNVGTHYFVWRYFQVRTGFCSTLAQPSYIAPEWQSPAEAEAAIRKELGRGSGLAPYLSEVRHVYHLSTAAPGCFNSETRLFYPWLRRMALDNKLLFSYEDLKQQIRIAVEQPDSPIGQKIRQIEKGQDRLRPVTGARAYWVYMIQPWVRLTMNPLAQQAVVYAFADVLERYEKEAYPFYPDFGAYLADTGFLRAGIFG